MKNLSNKESNILGGVLFVIAILIKKFMPEIDYLFEPILGAAFMLAGIPSIVDGKFERSSKGAKGSSGNPGQSGNDTIGGDRPDDKES